MTTTTTGHKRNVIVVVVDFEIRSVSDHVSLGTKMTTQHCRVTTTSGPESNGTDFES